MAGEFTSPLFSRSVLRHRLAAVLLACLSFGAFASNENASKSEGDVVLLPGLAMHVHDDSKSTLHFPGHEYLSGSGWWALSCSATCELAAVNLKASTKLHPQYDGPYVPGQLLVFTPLPKSESLLFFKPLRVKAEILQLQEGPVVTFYPSKASRLHIGGSTPGTMEAEIPLPDGELLRLVPVLQLPDPAKPPRPEWEDGAMPLVLELRLGNRRQALGQFDYVGLEGPEPVNPQYYVRWAGDLDRDGRLDLLISLGGSGTTLLLYLSSLAKDGEIVGKAGTFTYYPIDSAGC